jgi:hypothetical protein
MADDSKIIERDGKQYCTLPDGSQVQIENEILNDPNWVNVQQMEKLLGIGDRQIRNLAAKYSWEKKYAYVNKKPVSHYSRKQIESFQKERVTAADVVAPAEQAEQAGDKVTTGKELVSPETLRELDAVLKKVEPYVGEFLENYKKNNERIVALEDKKSTAEKTAVFWRTTALWVAVGGAFAAIAWFKADQINTTLNKTAGDLSNKYEETQKELFNTKLLLSQKENEMQLLKATQSSTSLNATAPERTKQ